ncbi:hypothetical protein [Thalassoglobus polymorphus]|uniref:hypothetical protein n=1 Tax=Thalassoglobus polymorphus TaxID=2527994 RepID=UPI0011A6BFDC|nr:hypothetical protein [Thalassoglobus polymorphus]
MLKTTKVREKLRDKTLCEKKNARHHCRAFNDFNFTYSIELGIFVLAKLQQAVAIKRITTLSLRSSSRRSFLELILKLEVALSQTLRKAAVPEVFGLVL